MLKTMRSVFIKCGGPWDHLSRRVGETVEVLGQNLERKFVVRFNDGLETEVPLLCLPDLMTYRLGEVIFDITSCATTMLHKEGHDLDIDSRDLYANIHKWAQEFEQAHEFINFHYCDDDDYMTEVEEFAYAKLREYFGMEE